MRKDLQQGYTCGCERYHAFPPYVFAITVTWVSHYSHSTPQSALTVLP